MRKNPSAVARSRRKPTRNSNPTTAKPAKAKPGKAKFQRADSDTPQSKAELSFMTSRYWREPGPPMTWHEELEELYIRAHEAIGACCVLTAEFPAATANPLPLDAPRSPTELRMGAVHNQIENLRVHLVRVMVAGHAHEAILAATYAKPVCDLVRKFYRSVLVSPDFKPEGMQEALQALTELREILVPIFRARAQPMGKHDLRLSDFDPVDVAKVRAAMEKSDKYSAQRKLSGISTQRFCRIRRLLKEEVALRTGSSEATSGTTNSAP